MPRFSHAIRAFNGGELSPRVEGRTDLPAYPVGGRTIENFIPLVTGPLIHRSGTRFVKEVSDSTRRTILIPFTVSTEAAYVIEAGHEYFRFYTQESRLESGGLPVELATTYQEGGIPDLQWAQSADTLYIVHPNSPPRKLVRTSATSFSIGNVDFLDGPYLDENVTKSKTLTASAATGNINITATGHTPFLAGRDEGRHIRIRDNTKQGWAKVNTVTSTSIVACTVGSDKIPTGAQHAWRLGAWYIGNYPRTVSFHEQRLCFAGAPNAIQRIDLSVTGDFERFSPTGASDDTDPSGGAGTPFPYISNTVNDDNAMAYTIGSNELNAILWIRVKGRLLMGTAQSLVEMSASSNQEALTPANVNVIEQDMTGASSVQPERIANSILFAGRAKRRLYAAGFDLNEDGTIATDMTELAEHVTIEGIREIKVSREPVPLVWMCMEDGSLASLTLRPSQKVYAWARHPMGGSGLARSIAVIPVADHDQLWMITERTINGAQRQYVEFMEEPFRLIDEDQAHETAFFVDSGVSYDGAPATVFTGLSHLEGQTVSILADGAAVPDQIVVGGEITLAVAASKVHAGLGRTALFQSLRLETPDPEQSSFGKSRSFDAIVLRLLDTLGGHIGSSMTNTAPILYRTAGDDMDAAPPLFTGEKRSSWPGGWTTEPRVVVKQTQPLPMTLLAISLLGEGGMR